MLGMSIIHSFGAGILTPSDSSAQDIKIESHDLHVTINNGFSKVKVTQTFFNPNPNTQEAIYSFPIPEGASLSEMTITSGDKMLTGEVVRKEKGRKIYEEEKSQGNDAGLSEKNGYQRYEFYVANIASNAITTCSFTYYQSLKIDTGIARFLYPLEEGGTDEAAQSFWYQNDVVEKNLSITVEIKSAWPIENVRTPGINSDIQKTSEGNYTLTFNSNGGSLNNDFLLYYKLQDNLPGRVEVIPYKESVDKTGSFMMLVTPGVDLKPITNGQDYIFVVDVSGSMVGKIKTVAEGINRSIEKMNSNDRFRVITFNNKATEITKGWVNATPENIQYANEAISLIQAVNGTNLFAGVEKGLKSIDSDRTTSYILITDAVANTGVVSPKHFQRLLEDYDIRFFGFLVGNGSNWPLMKVLSETTGGFYANVSNGDDIIGQILTAKNKVTHQAMHDVSVKINGVRTFDLSQSNFGQIFYGEQFVLYGKYSKAGEANLKIKMKISGVEQEYTTTFNFPEVDTDNPEIERLWAMNKIESIQKDQMLGKHSESEVTEAITDIGINYQLVTDETSMIVLSDEQFNQYGIERKNKKRSKKEHKAQAIKRSQATQNYRVDKLKPAFNHSAPNFGGGSFNPISLIGIFFIIAISRINKRKN